MTDWRFQRDAIRRFRFVDCSFDASTGVARLAYAFDEGPVLVETVTVPGAPFDLDGARAQAVPHLLGGDRQVGDAHAAGVEHGVGHGRRYVDALRLPCSPGSDGSFQTLK